MIHLRIFTLSAIFLIISLKLIKDGISQSMLLPTNSKINSMDMESISATIELCQKKILQTLKGIDEKDSTRCSRPQYAWASFYIKNGMNPEHIRLILNKHKQVLGLEVVIVPTFEWQGYQYIHRTNSLGVPFNAWGTSGLFRFPTAPISSEENLKILDKFANEVMYQQELTLNEYDYFYDLMTKTQAIHEWRNGTINCQFLSFDMLEEKKVQVCLEGKRRVHGIEEKLETECKSIRQKISFTIPLTNDQSTIDLKASIYGIDVISLTQSREVSMSVFPACSAHLITLSPQPDEIVQSHFKINLSLYSLDKSMTKDYKSICFSIGHQEVHCFDISRDISIIEINTKMTGRQYMYGFVVDLKSNMILDNICDEKSRMWISIIPERGPIKNEKFSNQYQQKKNAHSTIHIDDNHRIKHCKRGLFYYSNRDTCIGTSLDQSGEWGENLLNLFMDMTRKGDTIWDVGANIGAFTIPLAKHVGRWGRVYAFEPQRILNNQLASNVALNELENIHVIQEAIGEVNEEIAVSMVNFNIPANFAKYSLLRNFTNIPNLEMVSIRSLDKIYSKIGKCPILLKLDIEGMELSALRGGRTLLQECKPFIYLGNDCVKYSRLVIEELIANKYEMYWDIQMNVCRDSKEETNIEQNYWPTYNIIAAHPSMLIQREFHLSGYTKLRPDLNGYFTHQYLIREPLSKRYFHEAQIGDYKECFNRNPKILSELTSYKMRDNKRVGNPSIKYPQPKISIHNRVYTKYPHKIQPDSLCAILTGRNQSNDQLSTQLEAIFSSTWIPDQLFFYQNGGSMDYSSLLSRYPKVQHIWDRSTITNFYGRFTLPMLLTCEYMVVMDEDIIPGPRWFESSIEVVKQENAMVGYKGRRINQEILDCKLSFYDIKNCPAENSNQHHQVDYINKFWVFKTIWVYELWKKPLSNTWISNSLEFSIRLYMQKDIRTIAITDDVDGGVIGNDLEDELEGFVDSDWKNEIIAISQYWIKFGWIPCIWREKDGNIDNLKIRVPIQMKFPYDSSGGTISVLTTGFKKPASRLDLQLEAIFKASVSIDQVIFFQNGNYIDYSKVLKKYPKVRHIWYKDFNTKFHGRFTVPLLLSSQFMAILDDEPIPGNLYFEKAMELVISHRSLVGHSSRRIKIEALNGSTDYESFHNPVQGREIREVDFVGHLWVFNREWIHEMWQSPAPTLWTAEDIEFSARLQINQGINTITFDFINNSYWGSIVTSDEYNIHEESGTWRIPGTKIERTAAVQYWIDAGWVPYVFRENS